MSADERPHGTSHLSPTEWLDLLSCGDVEILGRLPWSSNQSFLVSVEGPSTLGKAVYKPGRGERPLWDFGPDIYRREVAAYELSAFLGLGLVPETVVRNDGPFGSGSLQRFVDADFEAHYFTLVEDLELHDRLRELAAFDVLCNSADRKSGHVLIDGSREIWAIDNGLTFHSERKLRTVIWEFAGEAIPARLIAACHRLVEDGVPPRVATLLEGDECDALLERARSMIRRPSLPAPRDDYRAYPWPLV